MIQYLHLPTKYKVLQPTFPVLGAIIKWRSTRSYSQHTSWTAVLPRGFHCNIVQLLSELEHRLDTSQAGTDSEKGLHLFWLYDRNSLRNKPQAEVLWNSVLGLSTNRWGLKPSGCTAVKKKTKMPQLLGQISTFKCGIWAKKVCSASVGTLGDCRNQIYLAQHTG